MRSANTSVEALSELLGDLKESFGIDAPTFREVMDQARSQVRELSNKGLQATKRRNLVKSIEFINKKYGAGFLEESFTKLGIEDVRRWASLTTTDDLMRFVSKDVSEGGFVRNLPAMFKAAEGGKEGAEEALTNIVRGLVDGDQIMVQSSDIPRGMRNLFTSEAKDPRIGSRIDDIINELPTDPVSTGATLDPTTGRLLTTTDEFLDIAADPLVDVPPTFGGLRGAQQKQLTEGLDAARAKRLKGLRKELKSLVRRGDTTEVPSVMSRALFDDLFGKSGVATRLMDPQAPHKFAKFWGDINRMWTGWTLGPFASWMNRNLVGNVWNNWLSGVGPKHTTTYFKAASIQDDVRLFMTGRASEIKGTLKVGSKAWKRADLVQEIVQDGINQGGFAYTAGGEEVLKSMSLHDLWRNGKQTLKGGKRQAARDVFARDPQQNLFSRSGFSINAVLEDIPRITHYLAKRSEGASREVARRSVVKALGNFRDLSTADEALRTVMPFWAWTRFNVPRQIRGLTEGLGGDIFTKAGRAKGFGGFRVGPTTMVAHLQLSMNDKFQADVPQEIVPEWLQGQMAIPMGINADGKFEFWSLNRWLPLADLTEIDSPKKMMQFLANSMSPFLSEPFEQAFNFDTFYKRVIEDYPGEQEHILGYPLTKRWAHVIRNARVVTEFDAWMSKIAGFTPTAERIKEERQWYERIMAQTGSVALQGARQFTGLKGREISLKRAKKFRVIELSRTVSDLKRRMKRAKNKGDGANARNFRRLWEDAKHQLKMARKFRPDRNPHFRGLELQ
jgi:hypothetical protein